MQRARPLCLVYAPSAFVTPINTLCCSSRSRALVTERDDLRQDKGRLLGVLRRQREAGLSESLIAHKERLRKRRMSQKEVRRSRRLGARHRVVYAIVSCACSHAQTTQLPHRVRGKVQSKLRPTSITDRRMVGTTFRAPPLLAMTMLTFVANPCHRRECTCTAHAEFASSLSATEPAIVFRLYNSSAPGL